MNPTTPENPDLAELRNATLQEKAAAFEWLRGQACDGEGIRHAAVLMVDIEQLRANAARLRIALRVVEWMTGDDTGISSMAIACAYLDFSATASPARLNDAPYHPTDFGRCYRLLTRIPELREPAFKALGANAPWRGLIKNWDELTAIYIRDFPSGYSKELHQRITELRQE